MHVEGLHVALETPSEDEDDVVVRLAILMVFPCYLTPVEVWKFREVVTDRDGVAQLVFTDVRICEEKTLAVESSPGGNDVGSVVDEGILHEGVARSVEGEN